MAFMQNPGVMLVKKAIKENAGTLVVVAVAAVLVTGAILFKAGAEKDIVVDPGFGEYVIAYTTGVISSRSPVRIELAREVAGVEPNQELAKSVLTLGPAVTGKAYWVGPRSIEFRPDQPFKGGLTYRVTLSLEQIMRVPQKYNEFTFAFEVIKQGMAVTVDGYQPYTLESMYHNFVTGSVLTADAVDDKALEQCMQARQDNRKLKIYWQHNPAEKKHTFTVDSVARGDEPSTVAITWDGAGINAEQKDAAQVPIPSVKSFSVLDVEAIAEPQQCIKIRFSDPIEKGQNLAGLITLGNNAVSTMQVDGLSVLLYPQTRQQGTVPVAIEEGIRNIAGGKLTGRQIVEVVFESIKPAVRLTGKGVILPGTQDLIFPFEAVNLKAVDVRIIKIYEDNLLHFLQENNIDNASALKRYGRLVARKTIWLNSQKPIVYSKWSAFSLDLAEYIKNDPGALYRVVLSYKQAYATYPCGDCAGCQRDEKKSETREVADEYAAQVEMEREKAEYDQPGYYYDYYDEYAEGYNWESREDPCAASYYMGHDHSVARNVYVSNIGLMAKGNKENAFVVITTDLTTAAPLSGVLVEAYNFQLQKIGSVETGSEGMATLPLETQPFVLVARRGGEKAYVRVDDGSALSLSNFDIAGVELQKGLKGFLYTERGVRRPGDTLHLGFILEDRPGKIPADHPVILELFNPQGKLEKRVVKTSGLNGMYLFSVATNDNDPTGNWEAAVRIGGTVFRKTIKVESVKPNRLKILFELGDGPILPGTVKTMLTSRWLHGVPAKDMKFDIQAKLGSTKTGFKGYERYIFDDPLKKAEAEEIDVCNGVLDNQGNAPVEFTLPENSNAPGALKAVFTTRVFEAGGDFSIDYLTKEYLPYPFFVGLKTPQEPGRFLITDTSHTFEAVTLTAKGKPADKRKLEVSVYKLRWRWWFDADYEDLADYTGDLEQERVWTTTVQSKQGKAVFTYQLKYPAWGRHLVRVTDLESGHSCGAYVWYDWPGWASRDDASRPLNASMLTFTSDKSTYTVGDKAVLTIPTPDNARLLISLENGSRVVRTFWENATAGAGRTMVSFPVTPEMAPTTYAHVTLVQPHAHRNGLPIRLYGVIPFNTEDPTSRLQPVIDAPEALKTEQKARVTVREKNGKPMTYTLAIVDEGLLGLTRFKTPDPHDALYAREALGVRTWDLYDYVLGAFGGKIEASFSIGGDNVQPGDAKKTKRFKPVVMMWGPFELASGSRQHEFTMPQYIGEVRVMVVAAYQRAYGAAEKSIPVRSPLMVLGTLPRVLGPDETCSIPVTVFAMEPGITSVKVRVDAAGPLAMAAEQEKNITVDKPGEYEVCFDAKTKSKTGPAKVSITASAGALQSQYAVDIEVRNPNPPLVLSQSAYVEAHKTQTMEFKLLGESSTNKATVEVSAMPPINLAGRLAYLLHYPYGCTEQTTSSAFPQLYLDKFITLSPAQLDERGRNIKIAVTKISANMRFEGGIAYWPGGHPDEYITSYAGHFMLEAQKQGFVLPPGFRDSWLKYQRSLARNWRRDPRYSNYYYATEMEQAYRLYTLALAGESELGAMNRLRESSGLTINAAWRLAAAYCLTGQRDVAQKIVETWRGEPVQPDRFNRVFGSRERDLAIMLETMCLLGDKAAAFPWLEKVAHNLSAERWMSTQEITYSFIGVYRYIGDEKSSGQIKCAMAIDGKAEEQLSSAAPILRHCTAERQPGQHRITFRNMTDGPLYARVVSEGIPLRGYQEAYANNLKLSLTVLDTKGREIDPARVVQGTDMTIAVTVVNTDNFNYAHLALSTIFPSGWEILNNRMADDPAQQNSFDYQDIRDDRVLTFFSLPAGGRKNFTFAVTAAYAGLFYMPGVLCEAMYDGTVNAFIPGKTVAVIK
jgi:uncharacterized protein YfaS (alpha-2-macroglobulin family)